ILKHRIGVPVNGESARYKEIKEDKYLIPSDWPEDWQHWLIYRTFLQQYHIVQNRSNPQAKA
ncbi:MAG: hypothetical protein EBV84_01930, partial [Betaproteobacteria bacterium]|nr:hypothetical protein [Betaproteobacteria bacterium]